MSLEIYAKDLPSSYFFSSKTPKIDRYFYALISLVGIFSIIFALWPLVAWQVRTMPKLTSAISAIPVPQSEVLSKSSGYVQNVQVIKDPDGFSYFTTNYKPQGPRPKEFYITIPKLKILDAVVKVDNLNLNQNLSHFPGSALPGEVGNVFITGHSVLPQFNDPKNYSTIFTKLPDLEIGDKVEVTVEGKTSEYLVQYAKVIDPQDVSVLAPISAYGKNLTLMTCVPPGTSLKRLVVVTSLI